MYMFKTKMANNIQLKDMIVEINQLQYAKTKIRKRDI
jgi:hypothetical protein